MATPSASHAVHQFISGIWYVEVPEECRTGDGGHLVFPAFPPRPSGEPVELKIRPEPGKLILFPSYFPHATVPLRVNERRMCVAFDVTS